MEQHLIDFIFLCCEYGWTYPVNLAVPSVFCYVQPGFCFLVNPYNILMIILPHFHFLVIWWGGGTHVCPCTSNTYILLLEKFHIWSICNKALSDLKYILIAEEIEWELLNLSCSVWAIVFKKCFYSICSRIIFPDTSHSFCALVRCYFSQKIESLRFLSVFCFPIIYSLLSIGARIQGHPGGTQGARPLDQMKDLFLGAVKPLCRSL